MRREKLEKLFVELDATLAGKTPTLAQVKALCDAEAPSRGDAYYRGLLRQYKNHLELRTDAQIQALLGHFDHQPTIVEVKNASLLMGLKWSRPRCAAAQKVIREKLADKGGKTQEYYTLRLHGYDAELFAKIERMFGLTRAETFSLLVRTFLLSTAQGKINPLEMARQARRLGASDAKRFSKVLDLNLKGLDR